VKFFLFFLLVPFFAARADETEKFTNAESASLQPPPQNWNFHVQSTFSAQGDLPFHATFSGANSLRNRGEIKETLSLDLMGGARLWHGAEVYVDGLIWQGFGLSDALGTAGFPNGEAFRVGTEVPNFTFARVVLRQTIGLGGEQEMVKDDALQLTSKRDTSRVTITVGKMSAKDIFDSNAYADDPRAQFLNWALMANGAWDHPSDAFDFIPGMAVELNQPKWAARYGFFAVPRVRNGLAIDRSITRHWAMAAELERRYSICEYAGSARLLGYVNHAHMRNYEDAVKIPRCWPILRCRIPMPTNSESA
jgi:high affinity Mn2+ porin